MGSAQGVIQTAVVALIGGGLVPLIIFLFKRGSEIRNLDADADS